MTVTAFYNMIYNQSTLLCTFQLLETLPNLVFLKLDVSVRLWDLHLLTRIAQQTALSHLDFSLEDDPVAIGLPLAGPEGLKSISMQWDVCDLVHRHLYEFLRPSLGTLT